jgi:hypothetical protein
VKYCADTAIGQALVLTHDRQFLGTGYAKSAHNDIFGSIRSLRRVLTLCNGERSALPPRWRDRAPLFDREGCFPGLGMATQQTVQSRP